MSFSAEVGKQFPARSATDLAEVVQGLAKEFPARHATAVLLLAAVDENEMTQVGLKRVKSHES